MTNLAAQLPPVLTVDQVATLVDCAPETVEEDTRQRLLPGLKFGRSWVYPTEALLQVLNARALAQVGPAAGVKPTAKQADQVRRLHVLPPAPAKPPRRARGASPAPLPDPPSTSS